MKLHEVSSCRFRIPESGGRVLWQITNRCNYACRYCIFRSRPDKIPGELGTKEALRVMDELKEAGFTHIKFTGGEPLFRPDISEIMRYANQKRFRVDLSTNASLISYAAARELNRWAIGMLHVGLDAHCEKINAQVRLPGTFGRTVSGIKACVKAGVYIRVGCVIFSGNQYHLPEMAEFCSGLGVRELIFSMMEPAGRMAGDRSMLAGQPLNSLIDKIESIRREFEGQLKISSNIEPSVESALAACAGGKRFLYIDNEGRVAPCTWVAQAAPDFVSRATLKEKGLSELLASSPIQSFRDSRDRRCEGCPVSRMNLELKAV